MQLGRRHSRLHGTVVHAWDHDIVHGLVVQLAPVGADDLDATKRPVRADHPHSHRAAAATAAQAGAAPLRPERRGRRRAQHELAAVGMRLALGLGLQITREPRANRRGGLLKLW